MAEPIAPLVAPLSALIAWLDAANVPFVIIGGVAASLLGRPRTTRDVDALAIADESRWADLLASAANHGLAPRVSDALDFANRSRVLLLQHPATHIELDIAFGALAFEQQAVRDAQHVTFQDLSIPLPRAEDLIIMKAVAGRVRDIGDIEAIVGAQPNLDTRYILETVTQFATALDQPRLVANLRALLR